jgi:GNAT superfamily N-acetyltransferase
MLIGMQLADLPPGLAARPLTPDDAPAVTRVVAAAEEHDVGEALIELEDVVSEWQRPGFDLASEAVGITSGDELVAAAEVYAGRRAGASVHPAWRGRGIGSWLLSWTEDLARTRGGERLGQTVAADGDAEELLRARGYQRLWTSWMLLLPEETTVPERLLPDGCAIRPFRAGSEDRVVHRVIEDAFNEWQHREPMSFEDWAAIVTGRPGFLPELLTVVTDPADDVVGACVLNLSGSDAFVHHLAVRRDRRGLGLGQALLADAFGRARSLGATRCELSTDSRTGALGLYEKVGMVVTNTWRHWITVLQS